MKILKSSAGALTNFEVIDLLRSRGAGKDPTRVIASVSPSEFKVFDYLDQTAARNQTRDIMDKLVGECKKYGLAKAEILNIANIRPSSAVEAYTMMEECETRIGDKIDELVETVVQVLPPHPSQVESNKEIVEDKFSTALAFSTSLFAQSWTQQGHDTNDLCVRFKFIHSRVTSSIGLIIIFSD